MNNVSTRVRPKRPVALMPFVWLNITRKFAPVDLELKEMHELNAPANQFSARIQMTVKTEHFARPIFADLNVAQTTNVLITRNVPMEFVPVLVKPMKLVHQVSSVNLVSVELVADRVMNVHPLLLVLIVNVLILALQDRPVVLMPFVELIIMKRFAHVNLELMEIQGLNVPDNRFSVRTQIFVEKMPFVRPMFADRNVIPTIPVLSTRNVPMVCVPLLVQMTTLVLLDLSANLVNVKRVVGRTTNVHLHLHVLIVNVSILAL